MGSGVWDQLIYERKSEGMKGKMRVVVMVVGWAEKLQAYCRL